MKNLNKKYLILLILLFTILSGINVFADEGFKPLELITDNDGTPIGTYFTRDLFFPWRYSSKQGGVFNDNGEGVWSYDGKSFNDKTMMQMMRGEIPNDRITRSPKYNYPLPNTVKEYLKNGGSVDNIKVKYSPRDLGNDQDWRSKYNATIPTGPEFNPENFYVNGKEPKYKIDPVKGTINIEFTYALKYSQLDDVFYGRNDNSNMKATVFKMNENYGFNGFSMWSKGGRHRGSASSKGSINVRQLDPSLTLTKDKIVDHIGTLKDGVVLHNLEGSKPEFNDTITSAEARIGYNTFASGGSIGYALINPMYVEFYFDETNNLRIGSEEYKIGDNYNAKLIDIETNKPLDPAKDKLILGKKYRFDYHVAFESTKKDKQQTNNAPILTNIYMYYNGRNENGPSDIHVPNIKSVNISQSLQKVNKTDEALNVEKWEESKIDVSKIAKYQQEFEMEKLTKDGKKIEKIRVCGYLPYQYNYYTEFNGDKALGDNDIRSDDQACLEFEVDTREANTLVAHLANNAIVKAGSREYDRLEIRKYSEGGQLINSVINTDTCDPLGGSRPDANVCGEISQGDKIQITAYVKREDLPPEPAGDKNPIYIRDISLSLNETINEQVQPIDRRESNTIYKTGFTRLQPKIAFISKLNANGTQGAFVPYEASTHGREKFEAGTILAFQMDYQVPEQNDLFGERSTKYNGYYAPVSKALVRWALSMDLSINSTPQNANLVNAIKTDDWTKTILNVSKDKRNMQIIDVIVKDENGSVVATKPNPNTLEPNPLILKADKNYQIEPRLIYEYIAGERSVNQNLKAEVFVVYDGLPPEKYGTSSKDLVESEKKGYWFNGDIGTYTIAHQPTKVNVAQYYPNANDYSHIEKAIKAKPNNVSVSPYSPLVIPLKHLKVSRGTIVVKIPTMYNGKGNDNELQAGWQVAHIPFVVDGIIDNSITIKGLYDTSNKDFGRSEDDCLPIDPTLQYYALIEVKRELGTGDRLERPSIEVFVDFDGQVDRKMVATIVEGSVIEKPGDKIVYRVNGLPGLNGTIKIKAHLPHFDSNMTNNDDFSCWEAKFNIGVKQFELYPKEISLPDQRPREVKTAVSFTAQVYLEDLLDSQYKKFDYYDLKVPIEIREFKDGRPTGNIYFSTYKYGKQEVHLPPSGKQTVEVPISGTFEVNPMIFREIGQYSYEISVNGGTGTDSRGDYNYRKYKEISPAKSNPYEDNVAKNYITVDGCADLDCPPCDTGGGRYRGTNNWTQKFISYDYYLTPEIIPPVYDAEGKMVSPTRYVCVSPASPSNLGRREDTLSFYERYSIKIFFQSQETLEKRHGINIGGTGGWIDITGRKQEVRAGQWFDIRVVSNYDQNRFPCRGGSVPFCSISPSYSVCHSRYSTPDTGYVQKEDRMYIRTIAYGKRRDYERTGPQSYYIIPNDRGSDISGNTNTRKYIPTHAVDGEYYVNAKNKPFESYSKFRRDENHPGNGQGSIQNEYDYIEGLTCDGRPKRCLTKCIPTSHRYFWDDVSATVVIKNQLNIKTQIIGN